MSEETTLPPVDNENANPLEAAASGWKSYVPSGDQRLVLSAIDGQLNAAKTAWNERNADKPNDARKDFFIDCIDKTGASLKKQLESVTIPADEAEVERALDSFQSELISTRPPFSSCPSSGGKDCDDESLSSVDDKEEDIEFDDNEILDQDAYNQVKQLRSQAREISARVISIREETAGRALEMTRRNLSELIRVHGFTENAEEGSGEAGEQEVDDTHEKRDSLNPMNTALQTLTSSLQNVDSGLAERLESLKETIGTIDSSVEKYQRMSQGDDSALSQTERALLASEKLKETAVESLDEIESPMNPDKALARLLAGVL
ncbi:hypothetical protein ACHAXR_007851 [Thalassiosira sp. AJA248-18]